MVSSTNTSERQKTLILVQESQFQRVLTQINKDAIVGWQNIIDIQSINDLKLNRSDLKKQSEKNTEDIISKYYDNLFVDLIVQNCLPLDIDRLESEDIPVKYVSSVKTLLHKAEEILKQHNLDWRSYAIREWEKSSIRHVSPDVWVQQFAELGHAQVAKHLLKSLRVVTEAELREAFKTSETDRIGLNVAHAFFHDDEAGSSSIAIQNVLEHMYSSPDKVIKINLASENCLADIKADVLFVYEDGLWSGVELVNRLNAICKTGHFTHSNLQLHFKYGTTSDVGLSAARLFAKREGLSHLQFRPAKSSHHFKFLKDGFDTRLEHLNDRNDEAIRKALDMEIEPYAFRSVEMWGEEQKEAISMCTEIGRQLVRPFLERKEQAKNIKSEIGEHTKHIDITDEMIAKWELGAHGFASTIVFASSIPKPVLPLMWLQGPVRLGNKSVDWRPLFWDARRTGQADA
ncbi:MAG TPA: hypothetical protein VIF37_10515 [Methylobacter sp.]